MVSHFTVDSAHTLREGDSVVDNHTPARGIQEAKGWGVIIT